MSFERNIQIQLLSQLQSAEVNQAQLNNALLLLSKWRSLLLQNTLLQKQGTMVMQGPVAGMNFLPQAAKSNPFNHSLKKPLTWPTPTSST